MAGAQMRVCKREIAAFALAPLPVVAPILIMFGLILVSLPRDWPSAAGAMLQLLLLSYGITLTIGLPLHLTLRRSGLVTLAAYAGTAAIAVVSVAVAFAIFDRVLPQRADNNPFALHLWSGFGLRMTLAGAALASLSAAIFWCVAVRPSRY